MDKKFSENYEMPRPNFGPASGGATSGHGYSTVLIELRENEDASQELLSATAAFFSAQTGMMPAEEPEDTMDAPSGFLNQSRELIRRTAGNIQEVKKMLEELHRLSNG